MSADTIAKALVIDDDATLCRLATVALTKAGIEVDSAHTGEEGLRRFFTGRPDVVVLDVRMPGLDGWETLRQIRRMSEVPVLMLTSESAEDDIVRGLELGADDYVAKPCPMRVLTARVQAALRRTPCGGASRSSVGYADERLSVDLLERWVKVHGQPVKLSAKEYGMLAYLVENAGRVLTARQILQHVWGWEYQDDVDYVRVYMAHLRGKLEEDPKNPQYLLTEHGVGYRFVKPASR